MKVYVKAASKKDINERLQAGKTVYGENHSAFGDGGTYELRQLNDGDVISVYDKLSGGSPVAKSYGTWDAKKGRVK